MAEHTHKKGHKRSANPVPAHSNAAAHSKVMTWLKRATPSQVMAVSVKAGVYTEQGNLTAHYKSTKR